MECTFYLAVVKHCSIEDNPNDDTIETEFPKVYLRLLTLIEFDTFVVTHGPYTGVDSKFFLLLIFNAEHMFLILQNSRIFLRIWGRDVFYDQN